MRLILSGPEVMGQNYVRLFQFVLVGKAALELCSERTHGGDKTLTYTINLTLDRNERD